MKPTKYIRLGIAAIILGFGSYTAHSQVSAEQTLAIGRDVLAMEDFVLAIQYFNQAAKAKPYLCEPYYFRGLSKMMLEDYAGAEADCSKAISRNKYKTEPYRVRGFCRLQLGLDSLALQDFSNGLAYAPRDRSFLYYKGVALSRLGRHAEADSTFGLILRYFPDSPETKYAKILNRLAAADTIAALSDLNSAIAADRYNVPLYIMRSRIHALHNEWDSALTDLNQAAAIAPSNAAVYVNRSLVSALSGNIKDAAKDCSTALEISPDNKEATALYTMLQRMAEGDSSATIPTPSLDYTYTQIEYPYFGTRKTGLQASLQKEKYTPLGFFAFTFTHPYTDLQPATNAYRELDSLNTSHKLPSPLYLSPTPGETPEAEQAVALFTYADSFDANPQYTMSYPDHMGRAVAYTMLKNYDAALVDADKAIAMHPEAVAPLMQRAYIYMALSNAAPLTTRMQDAALITAKAKEARAKALADIEAVLAIDSEMPYAWYDKGLILLEAEDFKGAVTAFTQALSKRPDFPEAIFNRAISYVRYGDNTRAATDFSKAGELGITASYRLLKSLKQ